MMDGGAGYPLYDLTSSGLNSGGRGWRAYEANRRRVGTMNWGDNFGLVAVDWARADPLVSLQVRDADGDINIQRKIPLSTLRPGAIR
jgi:alkaline phosphatase D